MKISDYKTGEQVFKPKGKALWKIDGEWQEGYLVSDGWLQCTLSILRKNNTPKEVLVFSSDLEWKELT